MGFCTFMKTVEVTRHRSGASSSTWKIAYDILQKDGIIGINKGVNAVALRQVNLRYLTIVDKLGEQTRNRTCNRNNNLGSSTFV
jgi:hypothetical protein